MLSIDVAVLLWINQFAHHFYALDAAVVLISKSYLLKGGVIMAMFWWEWFREGNDQEYRRELLLTNLLGSLAVIVVARSLAHFLPFRERPLQTPGLGLRLPYTMSADTLIHWSSFPSDHATFLCALATGLWMERRRLGMLAMAYVFVVVCIPRIYLGVHYPSDILAGALIGIGFAVVTESVIGQHWRGRWFTFWWSRRMPLLYVILFLLSYQIATMFDDVRTFGGLLAVLFDRWS
jgi:undecaprenyl-diphosphatase